MAPSPFREIYTKWGLPHQSAACMPPGMAPRSAAMPPGLEPRRGRGGDAGNLAPQRNPRPPPGLELLPCRPAPPSIEDFCGTLMMNCERPTGTPAYDPCEEIAANKIANTQFQAVYKEADTKEDVANYPCNPGSMGHPNFCRRICHHHIMGKCVNGNDCNFCHMPHLKRPMRLDKKHRKKLSDMSFSDFTSMIFPVIKKKIRGLNSCVELDHLIRQLEDHIRVVASASRKIGATKVVTSSNGIVLDGAGSLSQKQLGADPASEEELKRRHQFSSMLSAMELRALLAMVIRMTPPEMGVLRALLVQAREIIFEQNGASQLHRENFDSMEV